MANRRELPITRNKFDRVINSSRTISQQANTRNTSSALFICPATKQLHWGYLVTATTDMVTCASAVAVAEMTASTNSRLSHSPQRPPSPVFLTIDNATFEAASPTRLPTTKPEMTANTNSRLSRSPQRAPSPVFLTINNAPIESASPTRLPATKCDVNPVHAYHQLVRNNPGILLAVGSSGSSFHSASHLNPTGGFRTLREVLKTGQAPVSPRDQAAPTVVDQPAIKSKPSRSNLDPENYKSPLNAELSTASQADFQLANQPTIQLTPRTLKEKLGGGLSHRTSGTFSTPRGGSLSPSRSGTFSPPRSGTFSPPRSGTLSPNRLIDSSEGRVDGSQAQVQEAIQSVQRLQGQTGTGQQRSPDPSQLEGTPSPKTRPVVPALWLGAAPPQLQGFPDDITTTGVDMQSQTNTHACMSDSDSDRPLDSHRQSYLADDLVDHVRADEQKKGVDRGGGRNGGKAPHKTGTSAIGPWDPGTTPSQLTPHSITDAQPPCTASPADDAPPEVQHDLNHEIPDSKPIQNSTSPRRWASPQHLDNRKAVQDQVQQAMDSAQSRSNARDLQKMGTMILMDSTVNGWDEDGDPYIDDEMVEAKMASIRRSSRANASKNTFPSNYLQRQAQEEQQQEPPSCQPGNGEASPHHQPAIHVYGPSRPPSFHPSEIAIQMKNLASSIRSAQSAKKRGAAPRAHRTQVFSAQPDFARSAFNKRQQNVTQSVGSVDPRPGHDQHHHTRASWGGRQPHEVQSDQPHTAHAPFSFNPNFMVNSAVRNEQCPIPKTRNEHHALPPIPKLQGRSYVPESDPSKPHNLTGLPARSESDELDHLSLPTETGTETEVILLDGSSAGAAAAGAGSAGPAPTSRTQSPLVREVSFSPETAPNPAPEPAPEPAGPIRGRSQPLRSQSMSGEHGLSHAKAWLSVENQLPASFSYFVPSPSPKSQSKPRARSADQAHHRVLSPRHHRVQALSTCHSVSESVSSRGSSEAAILGQASFGVYHPDRPNSPTSMGYIASLAPGSRAPSRGSVPLVPCSSMTSLADSSAMLGYEDLGVEEDEEASSVASFPLTRLSPTAPACSHNTPPGGEGGTEFGGTWAQPPSLEDQISLSRLSVESRRVTRRPPPLTTPMSLNTGQASQTSLLNSPSPSNCTLGGSNSMKWLSRTPRSSLRSAMGSRMQSQQEKKTSMRKRGLTSAPFISRPPNYENLIMRNHGPTESHPDFESMLRIMATVKEQQGPDVAKYNSRWNSVEAHKAFRQKQLQAQAQIGLASPMSPVGRYRASPCVSEDGGMFFDWMRSLSPSKDPQNEGTPVVYRMPAVQAHMGAEDQQYAWIPGKLHGESMNLGQAAPNTTLQYGQELNRGKTRKDQWIHATEACIKTGTVKQESSDLATWAAQNPIEPAHSKQLDSGPNQTALSYHLPPQAEDTYPTLDITSKSMPLGFNSNNAGHLQSDRKAVSSSARGASSRGRDQGQKTAGESSPPKSRGAASRVGRLGQRTAGDSSPSRSRGASSRVGGLVHDEVTGLSTSVCVPAAGMEPIGVGGGGGGGAVTTTMGVNLGEKGVLLVANDKKAGDGVDICEPSPRGVVSEYTKLIHGPATAVVSNDGAANEMMASNTGGTADSNGGKGNASTPGRSMKDEHVPPSYIAPCTLLALDLDFKAVKKKEVGPLKAVPRPMAPSSRAHAIAEDYRANQEGPPPASFVGTPKMLFELEGYATDDPTTPEARSELARSHLLHRAPVRGGAQTEGDQVPSSYDFTKYRPQTGSSRGSSKPILFVKKPVSSLRDVFFLNSEGGQVDATHVSSTAHTAVHVPSSSDHKFTSHDTLFPETAVTSAMTAGTAVRAGADSSGQSARNQATSPYLSSVPSARQRMTASARLPTRGSVKVEVQTMVSGSGSCGSINQNRPSYRVESAHGFTPSSDTFGRSIDLQNQGSSSSGVRNGSGGVRGSGQAVMGHLLTAPDNSVRRTESRGSFNIQRLASARSNNVTY
eukprot:gene6422-3048_t